MPENKIISEFILRTAQAEKNIKNVVDRIDFLKQSLKRLDDFKLEVDSGDLKIAKAQLEGMIATTSKLRESTSAISFDKIRSEIAKGTISLNRLEKNIQATRDQLRFLGKSDVDFRRLKNQLIELEKAQRNLLSGTSGRSQQGGLFSSTGSLARLGRISGSLVAIGYAASRVVRPFKEATKTFAEFEQSMADVAAVSGATSQELSLLSQNALELAGNTQFTAAQVAELQKQFAKLGFDPKEIINATEATIDFATAIGEDLTQAATVAGTTVRVFGLDASETTRAVDVLTKSFNTSALDIEKFFASLKFVGPVAKAAGVDVEALSGTLAALANSGIFGSKAGTGLRRIFTDLSTEGSKLTKFLGIDAIKSVDDYRNALVLLGRSQIDNSDAFDLVGRVAQSALLSISQNTDAILEYNDALNQAAGTAKNTADIQRDTLQKSFEILLSAVQRLSIALVDNFDEPLRNVVDSVTGFVNSITGLIEKTSSIRTKELVAEYVSLSNSFITFNGNAQRQDEILSTITSKFPQFNKELGQTLELSTQIGKAISENIRELRSSEKLSADAIGEAVKDLNDSVINQINDLGIDGITLTPNISLSAAEQLDILRKQGILDLQKQNLIITELSKTENNLLNGLEKRKILNEVITDEYGKQLTLIEQINSNITEDLLTSVQIQRADEIISESNKTIEESFNNLFETVSEVNELRVNAVFNEEDLEEQQRLLNELDITIENVAVNASRNSLDARDNFIKSFLPFTDAQAPIIEFFNLLENRQNQLELTSGQRGPLGIINQLLKGLSGGLSTEETGIGAVTDVLDQILNVEGAIDAVTKALSKQIDAVKTANDRLELYAEITKEGENTQKIFAKQIELSEKSLDTYNQQLNFLDLNAKQIGKSIEDIPEFKQTQIEIILGIQDEIQRIDNTTSKINEDIVSSLLGIDGDNLDIILANSERTLDLFRIKIENLITENFSDPEGRQAALDLFGSDFERLAFENLNSTFSDLGGTTVAQDVQNIEFFKDYLTALDDGTVELSKNFFSRLSKNIEEQSSEDFKNVLSKFNELVKNEFFDAAENLRQSIDTSTEKGIQAFDKAGETLLNAEIRFFKRITDDFIGAADFENVQNALNELQEILNRADATFLERLRIRETIAQIEEKQFKKEASLIKERADIEKLLNDTYKELFGNNLESNLQFIEEAEEIQKNSISDLLKLNNDAITTRTETISNLQKELADTTDTNQQNRLKSLIASEQEFINKLLYENFKYQNDLLKLEQDTLQKRQKAKDDDLTREVERLELQRRATLDNFDRTIQEIENRRSESLAKLDNELDDLIETESLITGLTQDDKSVKYLSNLLDVDEDEIRKSFKNYKDVAINEATRLRKEFEEQVPNLKIRIEIQSDVDKAKEEIRELLEVRNSLSKLSSSFSEVERSRIEADASQEIIELQRRFDEGEIGFIKYSEGIRKINKDLQDEIKQQSINALQVALDEAKRTSDELLPAIQKNIVTFVNNPDTDISKGLADRFTNIFDKIDNLKVTGNIGGLTDSINDILSLDEVRDLEDSVIIDNLTKFSQGLIDINELQIKLSEATRSNSRTPILTSTFGCAPGEDFEQCLNKVVQLLGRYVNDVVQLFQDLSDLRFQNELNALAVEQEVSNRRLEILQNELSQKEQYLQSFYDADVVAQKDTIEDEILLERQKNEEILAETERVKKEQFEKNKRFAIAQAIINGAQAVVQALAQLGPIAGAIAATIVGAATAIQIATIQSQRYTGELGMLVNEETDQYKKGGKLSDGIRVIEGGSVPDKKGMIKGRRHSKNPRRSGVKVMTHTGKIMEFEGGEITTRNGQDRHIFTRGVNKNPTLKKAAYLTHGASYDPIKTKLASYINYLGGGHPFGMNKVSYGMGGNLMKLDMSPKMPKDLIVSKFLDGTLIRSSNKDSGDISVLGEQLNVLISENIKTREEIKKLKLQITANEVKTVLDESNALVNNATI